MEAKARALVGLDHDPERQPLFGEAGGQQLAAGYEVPLLGQIPLHKAIREHSDAGQPVVLAEPDGPIAEIYRSAATQLMAVLGQQQPAAAPVISMGD